MTRRRITVLLALLTMMAFLGVSYGVYMMIIPIDITGYDLVDNVQTVSFNVTTYTVATLNETLLCDVHTYGQDYTVIFRIGNTTGELQTLFDEFNATIRLEGGSFDQSVLLTMDSLEGGIQVSPSVHDYQCYVTIGYSSKDQTGTMTLAVNIWAEE